MAHDVGSATDERAVAFLFNRTIRVPSNYREFYVTTALRELGVRVLWFSSQKHGNHRFDDQPSLVRIHDGRKLPRLLRLVIYPYYVALVLRAHSVGLVWMSGWNERSPAYLRRFVSVMKRFGIRVVYDPIDPIYQYLVSIGRTDRLKRVRNRLNSVYRNVDLTFVPTEQLRDALVDEGAPPAKVDVAWYGTNLDLFNPDLLVQHEGPTELAGKFVIGWLGHMSPFKGIEDILIPLIENLPAEVPNVHFVVGGEGILEPKLRELACRDSAPLTLYGRVPYADAVRFTAGLHLYLVPIDPGRQLSQAVRPVKLFDALALGIPVVTTGTPATLFLRERFPSLTYCDYDYESYKRAIVSLMANYEKISMLAKADVSKIHPFDNRSIATGVAERLKSLLGAARE